MGRGRQATVQSKPDVARETDLAELHEMLKGLRQQLAETMERIEKLDEEG
jgi:hypothetical protein